MKKLFPLLLFGVAIIFSSCEKNEATIAKAEFASAKANLTFDKALTIDVKLTRPAVKDIEIPFELLGDAVEGTDFKFANLDGEHKVFIPEGHMEGKLVLEHLLHNSSTLSTRVILKPGSGFELGGNNVCVITVGNREKIFISFEQESITVDEFTIVNIGVKLTGEKSGENFVAPENITLKFRAIPQANAQDTITTVPNDGWSWVSGNNDNNTVVIEEGRNSASQSFRIKYASATLPEGEISTSKLPRVGITLRDQASVIGKGFEFGAIDTMFVYYRQMSNPIEGLLMGKKWINPELGNNMYYAERNNFQKNMYNAEEDYDALPWHNKFTDNFVFTKTDDDKYMVSINADPSSDINMYFLPGEVSFLKYRNIGTPYLSASTGQTPGFSLTMPVNKAFSYDPDQEFITTAEVVFIPGSMSGSDNSYMDIIVMSDNYARYPGHFYYPMQILSSYVGMNGAAAARMYDVWYRVYEDKTPVAPID